jgi:small subunit ribosomal protein S27Ae
MADKKGGKDAKVAKGPKTPQRSKKDAYGVSKEGKLERKKKHCPKCGPGVFLAEHADRLACGKCSYTEFKKK